MLLCPSELLNWREIFGGTARFRDPRPVYASLNKDSEPVTVERLLATGKIKDDFDLNTISPLQKVLLWLALHPSLDMAFTTSLHPISRGEIMLPRCDAYVNLRVRNASYARLSLQGEIGKFLQPLEMVRNEQGEFSFPSLTLDSPLFGSVVGGSVTIETDGDILELGQALMSYPAKSKLIALGNSHAVSWFDQDHVVMIGHLWVPNFIVRISDLCEVPDKEGEKEVL